ncbi:hypothetical protein ABD67_10000 [Bacillus sonorensis]|uniref:hypothetical protein n=1 Tax=Bacillus sonorensis TaxID=119858 RepID=UPI0018CCB844|nr:hypothetical protein [Bacillus sonorensis]MBG9915239.1 hypothetical protein [Bacillus sonorensis]
MTETKKYVRILKAGKPSYWYADKIGQVFVVTCDFGEDYTVIHLEDAYTYCVAKEDAELIVTEKRPAKVGERVLITNAVPTGRPYKHGDILRTNIVNSLGDVWVNEHGILIHANEYEVIINNEVKNGEDDEMIKSGLDLRSKSAEEIQEFITEALSALRQRARYEGRVQGKTDGYLEAMTKRSQKSEEKTAQERRDEIVEQAKADVERLRTNNRLWRTFDITFDINRESRTVEAVAKKPNSRTAFYGTAVCAPDDCFNVHIGEAIALHRALGLEVPDEYLNAPQPTEVRVGDIVKLIHNGEVIDEYRVSKIEDDRVYDHDNTWAPKRTLKIIDDSRTEVDG